MIFRLILMFIVGAFFGFAVTGLIYLMWTDYQAAKEDEEFDNALRDMEQYYLAEYYQDGKENK